MKLVAVGAWRNGSASDSRSEGWVFESLRPHLFFIFCKKAIVLLFIYIKYYYFCLVSMVKDQYLFALSIM